MYGATEVPFYNWLQQIARSHRSASCCQKYVSLLQTFLDGVDMGRNTVEDL
jgi:hypothetical protein